MVGKSVALVKPMTYALPKPSHGDGFGAVSCQEMCASAAQLIQSSSGSVGGVLSLMKNAADFAAGIAENGRGVSLKLKKPASLSLARICEIESALWNCRLFNGNADAAEIVSQFSIRPTRV